MQSIVGNLYEIFEELQDKEFGWDGVVRVQDLYERIKNIDYLLLVSAYLVPMYIVDGSNHNKAGFELYWHELSINGEDEADFEECVQEQKLKYNLSPEKLEKYANRLKEHFIHVSEADATQRFKDYVKSVLSNDDIKNTVMNVLGDYDGKNLYFEYYFII